MRVLLYGSGNRCKILLKLIKLSDVEVLGIVDGNPQKCGTCIEDYRIYGTDHITEWNAEYVCVTFFGENDYESIWDELVERYKFAKNQILSFHDLLRHIYHDWIHLSDIMFEGKLRTKAIFAGAWRFEMGGVETWINETFSALVQQNKDIYLLSKKNQCVIDQNVSDKVIDFYINESCSFSIANVECTTRQLIAVSPCVLVCSRVDEVLLSASMLHKAYPGFCRIIAVVHGSCDGIVRDFYSYYDAIDKFLCVSSSARRALMALGVEEDRIEIITSPITGIYIGKRQYTLDNEKPIRIGYAGRIEVFHKRADLLIQLIKELETLKVNYYFEIVGSGGYVQQLIHFIEEHHLHNKVIYKGLIDRKDIFDYWLDKDIAINVSDSEGRPISNIEAMICGAVPVVTSTAGILDDVINGVTGYTVGAGDMKNMARIIEYLSHHRSTIQEVGENARGNMTSKTDMQTYVARWNKILGEV